MHLKDCFSHNSFCRSLQSPQQNTFFLTAFLESLLHYLQLSELCFINHSFSFIKILFLFSLFLLDSPVPIRSSASTLKAGRTPSFRESICFLLLTMQGPDEFHVSRLKASTLDFNEFFHRIHSERFAFATVPFKVGQFETEKRSKSAALPPYSVL